MDWGGCKMREQTSCDLSSIVETILFITELYSVNANDTSTFITCVLQHWQWQKGEHNPQSSL